MHSRCFDCRVASHENLDCFLYEPLVFGRVFSCRQSPLVDFFFLEPSTTKNSSSSRARGGGGVAGSLDSQVTCHQLVSVTHCRVITVVTIHTVEHVSQTTTTKGAVIIHTLSIVTKTTTVPDVTLQDDDAAFGKVDGQGTGLVGIYELADALRVMGKSERDIQQLLKDFVAPFPQPYSHNADVRDVPDVKSTGLVDKQEFGARWVSLNVRTSSFSMR